MKTIIKENAEYTGSLIHKWLPEHQNVYVITGCQQGSSTVDTRVGRVAQVRLESGEFGSDNVLLRHIDDTLVQHSNQFFWLIPVKFKAYLDECFKDVYLDKADEVEYTLNGKEGAKGFIIPSPIKEGESTPMRDVKSAIFHSISKMIK